MRSCLKDKRQWLTKKQCRERDSRKGCWEKNRPLRGLMESKKWLSQGEWTGEMFYKADCCSKAGQASWNLNIKLTIGVEGMRNSPWDGQARYRSPWFTEGVYHPRKDHTAMGVEPPHPRRGAEPPSLLWTGYLYLQALVCSLIKWG